ncbi:MAG: ferrous iron transport protein B [Bacteroidetes bacterium]|nr:ferrous iron transport protein B [Bacteroidota bacterium]
MSFFGRPSKNACEGCGAGGLQLGLDTEGWDFVVALAGNPNTGKSTVFNDLTGLRQHVGNWPGKTVARAEGGFAVDGHRFKLVDLPGTYSLFSASTDEEIARDFILFGRPDCTVIVVDATTLERNLNLVLQILEVTDRAVVCLNLMDEARRKGIRIDDQALSENLGVPVIPTIARTGHGLPELTRAIRSVAVGDVITKPHRINMSGELREAVSDIACRLQTTNPGILNGRWVAMRLLEGDARVSEAVESGEFSLDASPQKNILQRADELRRSLQSSFRDQIIHAIYSDAELIVDRSVKSSRPEGRNWDQTLDRILTSKIWGLPIMFLGLALLFWITIVGANYPSSLIAQGLFWFEGVAADGFEAIGAPWWLTGFLWHGVYRGLAWVTAVMLPPMAIFFPMFTILENLGYLPRVAFNLDRIFRFVGGHGKQALTMSMGFGCNAAGVIACRIIDSPRERLVAILTNNFVPCNGRYPTLIMLAVVFVAASFPPALASVVAAGAVVGAVMVGIFFTFLVSWALSRSVLKGESSSFTLELSPYRRPNIGQIIYTSLIDRTLFVLFRAIVMAAPAGGLIWLLSNISVGDQTIAIHVSSFLDAPGRVMGLDGVILLAYIVAIPANEIVVPTILMTYVGGAMMFEFETLEQLRVLLVEQQGWTVLTAVSLMLFSVLHNPCSTTIWTIYKETRSIRWTTLGALMPLGIAIIVTIIVAQTAYLLF